MKLNIGCGNKKLDGWTNIDISDKYKPDMVADVCDLRGINSNTVDEIFIAHTLEHVADFEQAMAEMHRVLRKDGVLRIVVPWAGCNSAFLPWHRWHFSFSSFSPYEDGNDHDDYVAVHFSDVRTEYWFGPCTFWMKRPAGRFFWIYENTLISHLLPARELHITMVK